MSGPLGLPAGQLVGRDFRVVRLLASGAMGSVYIVDQLSTGKQRALKVMTMELAANAKACERFVLEARIAADIESDHVVEIVTAGIDDDLGVPFLVMELLKGEELSDMLERERRLPLESAAEILSQAGHALESAHEKGIVHRDLKPENLFIATSRREGVPFTVKILDFGIAKLVAERPQEGTQPVGTPLFMSPEQTDRRGHISPATDVWPLGLIAFLMLTGEHYWLGGSRGITALLREVVMEPIVPPSERAAALGVDHLLPAGFDAWFLRCVERDPALRYANGGQACRAFVDTVALGRKASGSTIITTSDDVSAVGATHIGVPLAASTDGAVTSTSARDARQTSSGGGSKLVPLAAAGVVALLGIGGYFVFAGGTETPAPAGSATAPVVAPSASVAPPVSPCPDGMVLIDGGQMFMGSADADMPKTAQPTHPVKVTSFCLDVTEVTVAQYQACSTKGKCQRAHQSVKIPGVDEPTAKHLSGLCNEGREGVEQHPMNCVDWNMASRFCSADGGRLPEGGARLPTEAEWEYAARGSDQRTFPWGDEDPDETRLNACGSECVAWHEERELGKHGAMYEGTDGFAATAPVGSFPAGKSAAGVLDLAGNVWEWTGDWYGAYTADEQTDPKGVSEEQASTLAADDKDAPGEPKRVMRGGDFFGQFKSWCKPAMRYRQIPSARLHTLGFRCAMAARAKPAAN